MEGDTDRDTVRSLISLMAPRSWPTLLSSVLPARLGLENGHTARLLEA